MSANYDFKLERGATWNRRVNIANPPDQLPNDLSGLTSTSLMLFTELNASSPAVELTIGDGITQDDNDFYFTIDAIQTATMSRDHYHYKFILVFDDLAYIPLTGKFLMNNGGQG